MSRYGVRGTAALNSEICDHHPQIIEAALKLGWEFMGHCQTNAVRLNEMEPEREREAIHDTLERIGKATGKKPLGWLGAGLAETWNTLDFLIEEGCLLRRRLDSDDLPFRMSVNGKTLFSIPYTLHCNDTVQFFDQKASAEEFGNVLKRQFDCLYREAAETPRVMAIALHPFVSGAPYRIGAVDDALDYICSHAGVWLATGEEIIRHYAQGRPEDWRRKRASARHRQCLYKPCRRSPFGNARKRRRSFDLMLAALMILRHLAYSERTKAPNCSGVFFPNSLPSPASFSATSGSGNTRTMTAS